MTSKLINERLRYHLNAEQPRQERLCTRLLMANPRYSNVEGQLPEGGPDGGIDITAVYLGEHEASGAAGFINDACDTNPAHKKQITAKFKSDLAAALAKNPLLEAFVFFTNMDFTPGEKKTLTAHAVKAARKLRPDGPPLHVEFYTRERIAQDLTRPVLVPLRSEVLEIPPTQEEIVAAIARSNEILASQQRTLARIEFLQAAHLPIVTVALDVELTQPVDRQTLGNMSLLVGFTATHGIDTVGLWLAMTNGTIKIPTVPGPVPRLLVQMWSDEGEVPEEDSSSPLREGPQVYLTSTIRFAETPEMKLGDLNNRCVFIYAQGDLVNYMKAIRVAVNGYRLVDADVPSSYLESVSAEMVPDVKWLRERTAEEKKLGWTEINYGLEAMLDFNERTPRRIG